MLLNIGLFSNVFLQVFLARVQEPDSTEKNKFTTTLAPICSNPIFNKHAEHLKIIDISDNQDTVAGKKKIIILTEKLPKPEDIAIRFSDPTSEWSDYGQFEPANIHKQVAITLKVPRYCQDIQERKKVILELIKVSDNCTSDPIDFFYTPECKYAVVFNFSLNLYIRSTT